MANVRQMLDKEIEKLLKILEKIDPVKDNDKYVNVMNRVTSLMDKRTAQDQVDIEREKFEQNGIIETLKSRNEQARLEFDKNKMEKELKLESDKLELERQKIDIEKERASTELKVNTALGATRTVIDTGLSIAKIVTNVGLFFNGLEFEKTGTIASNFGRQVVRIGARLFEDK